MTDLSAIFSSKSFVPSASLSNKPIQQPTYFQSQQDQYRETSHSPFLAPPSSYSPRKGGSEIIISNAAKKLITYSTLQAQVRWFWSQNILECFLKSIFVGFLGWILYLTNWISWNTSFTMFIFVFLIFGLQHCIFGAKHFQTWACISLFAANLIAVNEVLLSTLNIISPTLHQSLYSSHHSLIASAYISTLLIIIVLSQSLLSQPSPSSLVQNVNRYYSSFVSIIKIIYSLKIALAQMYSILLILTFIGAYLLTSNVQSIEQLFSHIMHPTVLLAEVVTFWLFVIAMDFIFRILSGALSRFAISVLYNKKNQTTKLPIMLQLLRVSYDDAFGVHLTPQNYQQKEDSFFTKLTRPDSSIFIDTKPRKLKREQLQNIYKHCLCWLKDLIQVNPNALTTPITFSKFYTNYYDVLKQFTESELRRYSNNLFDLHQKIESLTTLRKNVKGLKDDLFYWFKVLAKQFIIWVKAVQCCSMLSFMDLMLEILTTANISSQLWRQSSIGHTLNEIRQKTSVLSTNQQLNPIIRLRMEEYSNKTNRILKTD